MYKLTLLFAALLVFASASPLKKVSSFIRDDKCVSGTMDIIEPMIEEKLNILKEVESYLIQDSENEAAQAELLALVQQAKMTFDKCDMNTKVEPVLGDAVEAAGIAFLLASNCFKDLGAVLLIADSVIQDPSDWKTDIIVAIFVAILGRQSYADCEQFLHFVL